MKNQWKKCVRAFLIVSLVGMFAGCGCTTNTRNETTPQNNVNDKTTTTEDRVVNDGTVVSDGNTVNDNAVVDEHTTVNDVTTGEHTFTNGSYSVWNHNLGQAKATAECINANFCNTIRNHNIRNITTGSESIITNRF